ncbi:MAG: cell division protein Fic [Ardenticatenaceae bacterium]|nr:MAG: cell division protein Fic [Ardenticatenaceae bacterium]
MFEPNYHISPFLLNCIKEITLLVHTLNQQVVSEVVLVQMQGEARAVSTYASTSIEGNPLPLTKVKQLLKSQPKQLRDSEREVVNYNHVLTWLNNESRKTLSLDLLLRIHAGVVDKLLPTHQTGRLRQEPVVVYDPRSGDVVYLPPDYGDVPRLMADLLAFVQANQGVLDPILLAGLLHKQLVVIHPFVDGNGRTTRLATKLLLAELGLNTFNLFSFENYYNQNVTRYFQKVGLFGNYNDLVESLDFTPWLEYFAGGILDELLRVQKQIDANLATPDTTLKPHHEAILAHLDEHGFITDKEYAKITERAKATRSLDFKHLLELGLIERKGRGRGIYYQRMAEL